MTLVAPTRPPSSIMRSSTSSPTAPGIREDQPRRGNPVAEGRQRDQRPREPRGGRDPGPVDDLLVRIVGARAPDADSIAAAVIGWFDTSSAAYAPAGTPASEMSLTVPGSTTRRSAPGIEIGPSACSSCSSTVAGSAPGLRTRNNDGAAGRCRSRRGRPPGPGPQGRLRDRGAQVDPGRHEALQLAGLGEGGDLAALDGQPDRQARLIGRDRLEQHGALRPRRHEDRGALTQLDGADRAPGLEPDGRSRAPGVVEHESRAAAELGAADDEPAGRRRFQAAGGRQAAQVAGVRTRQRGPRDEGRHPGHRGRLHDPGTGHLGDCQVR